MASLVDGIDNGTHTVDVCRAEIIKGPPSH
jgi:hypothetical protein